MALLINQGKQDTTQDNKFNPIVEKDVLAQVTEIKLAQKMTNTLEITYRLLNGNHKGRFVFDRINYDPKSNMSWKYRALRKSAGVPYEDNEPATVDIEALLLNKAVTVDLSVRKGKNSAGEDTDYQDIKYKVLKNITPAATIVDAMEDIYEANAAAMTDTQPSSKTENTPTSVTTKENLNLVDDTDWD